MNHTSLSSKYKTRPSSSRTYTQLSDCLVSPLVAATSKGGNHSWQRTRQPKQPRTTVYKLFRVQYLPTVPNQYPKYTKSARRYTLLGVLRPINIRVYYIICVWCCLMCYMAMSCMLYYMFNLNKNLFPIIGAFVLCIISIIVNWCKMVAPVTRRLALLNAPTCVSRRRIQGCVLRRVNM